MGKCRDGGGACLGKCDDWGGAGEMRRRGEGCLGSAKGKCQGVGPVWDMRRPGGGGLVGKCEDWGGACLAS